MSDIQQVPLVMSPAPKEDLPTGDQQETVPVQAQQTQINPHDEYADIPRALMKVIESLGLKDNRDGKKLVFGNGDGIGFRNSAHDSTAVYQYGLSVESTYLTVAESRKFHHHENRHTHKGQRSLGKGGARFRYHTVPASHFIDGFPICTKIYDGFSGNKLTTKEVRENPAASQLKDSLFWVRGTLAALGASPRVIQDFTDTTHCLGDGLGFCSADLVHLKQDVATVGDLMTQVLFDQVVDMGCNSGDWESQSCLEPSWIRAALGDIVGEISRQRKAGQCSGKADWSSLDMSNPVSRVFKEFAQALDAQAKSSDVFSWQAPGKIFYRAMTKLSANPSLFELKLATLDAARALYPHSKLRFVLKDAWKKIESEMKNNTGFTMNGQSVQSVVLTRQGGFTGLTEQASLNAQALTGSLAEWLSSLSPGPVKLPKGAADIPVCKVILKLADGSEVIRYYNPLQIPEEVQSLLDTAEWGVVPKE